MSALASGLALVTQNLTSIFLYTAAYVFPFHLLSLSFGWPTIAVDTHIYRVSNRTKLAMGKTVEKVEEKLLKVIPTEFKVDVHHWLILHGRYTCVARKPRCGACIIEDLCEFKEKTA